MLSVLFGLTSALAWGGGDFVGGLASRKVGAYRAVLYAEFLGLLFLLGAAVFWLEPFIGWQNLLLAGLAGAIGSFGLLILYQVMATRPMSIAMPVSALLAAALPVIVGAVLEGFPTLVKLAGFAVALLAVWLVAQETGEKTHLERISDLRLPLLAGLCFGTYFIILHQASSEALLWPMLASRTAGSLLLVIFMLFRRESWRVSAPAWPLILLNGILDVGGNAFYILAGQTGRLDVAAVLSSLYPGATVILAGLILKEKINALQKLGVLLALLAIALLTL